MTHKRMQERRPLSDMLKHVKPFEISTETTVTNITKTDRVSVLMRILS